MSQYFNSRTHKWSTAIHDERNKTFICLHLYEPNRNWFTLRASDKQSVWNRFVLQMHSKAQLHRIRRWWTFKMDPDFSTRHGRLSALEQEVSKNHLVPPTGRTDGLSGAQWQPDHLIGHTAADSSCLLLSDSHAGLLSAGSLYTT